MEHQLCPEESVNSASSMDVIQAAHQDRAQEKISPVLKELNDSTMDDVGPVETLSGVTSHCRTDGSYHLLAKVFILTLTAGQGHTILPMSVAGGFLPRGDVGSLFLQELPTYHWHVYGRLVTLR